MPKLNKSTYKLYYNTTFNYNNNFKTPREFVSSFISLVVLTLMWGGHMIVCSQTSPKWIIFLNPENRDQQVLANTTNSNRKNRRSSNLKLYIEAKQFSYIVYIKHLQVIYVLRAPKITKKTDGAARLCYFQNLTMIVFTHHKFLSLGSSHGNPRKSNTSFSVPNFKTAVPLLPCQEWFHQNNVDVKYSRKNHNGELFEARAINWRLIPVCHLNPEWRETTLCHQVWIPLILLII